MGKELGTVTYDKEAALYPGAEYAPYSSMKAEVLLYETNPIE